MSKITRALNDNELRWDDNQVEMGRVRLGSSAPTWRTYAHGIGGGVAFDVLGFAVNNYIYFVLFWKLALFKTLKAELSTPYKKGGGYSKHFERWACQCLRTKCDGLKPPLTYLQI